MSHKWWMVVLLALCICVLLLYLYPIPTAPNVVTEQETAPAPKVVTEQDVLNPDNWHRAIYNEIEYSIYTGPGVVVFAKWAGPYTPPKAVGSNNKAIKDVKKEEPKNIPAAAKMADPVTGKPDTKPADELKKMEESIKKAEAIKPNVG